MPAATSSLPFSPAELAYLHTSLSSVPPLRPDARPLATDFRPLRAETDVLPAVNGSAHVGFSDGREAIVGVKLEVEKTVRRNGVVHKPEDGAMEVDADHIDGRKEKGRADWVTLTLTLPGLRDDDANLAFLEEMLREPLVVPSAPSPLPSPSPSKDEDKEDESPGLLDRLVINSRWHWHMYIDVVLVSSHGLASYPLPLLSVATHLALRDTRVPRLKSEGEEDPIADDDWMASTYLYQRHQALGPRPPVTLLVVVVGDNVIFDPSREELAVADGIVAVSVEGSRGQDGCKLLAIRMVDSPARDTMKGVPQLGETDGGDGVGTGVEVPGVWKPRVGGLKTSVLKAVVKTVTGGVAQDVMAALDGFLTFETNTHTAGAGASVG